MIEEGNQRVILKLGNAGGDRKIVLLPFQRTKLAGLLDDDFVPFKDGGNLLLDLLESLVTMSDPESPALLNGPLPRAPVANARVNRRAKASEAPLL